MGGLPDEFEGERLDDIEGVTEDATPATVLVGPDGAQFVVVGTGPDEYVGGLANPSGSIEGYYRFSGSGEGLTEALAPFLESGWEMAT